ncbi:DNA/RNA polymerase [Neolentinus lepideus HHB14362 ss-1]|uniref:DNA polymerase kappa n=1 Tax=Neolentinus lepideus HHB14362 ss-1 TaxID=1314782 RepID=A0A165V1K9_9AGAM|nr:DNA/RNA polymerase [Neolentinus lepideus HHB14362 ss-1]
MPAPEASQDTASLVKRLAGPSVTKAGLAKDQTEINQIIAEASKGSKFYDNEKRKDKDLTERIAGILKQRGDLLRNADIPKIERTVDHMIADLEAHRDLTQIIVHVDMDAFYANVEMLDNPSLAGKPFGVGHLHGVLTTASYEARKYGARSGMPGFIAKKLCPDLIFVDMHFKRYSEMSDVIMAIFKQYDPNMYPAGCDEGYLNITKYCEEHSLSAENCVQEMRERVRRETNLTVSAGIAPNKMLAKICSDKNKPNGQFHLPFDRNAIVSFMHDLSIRKIPGIGRVNERLLESIGIKTCGDIYTYRATLCLMDKYFGLQFLLRTHLGIASNSVQPVQREERKSIGAERTFSPLGDKEQILKKLEEVALELESDMQKSGWAGRTLTLKYKLDTYQVFTRAKSFDRWISKKDDLFSTGKELLMHEWPVKLRLIGLRMTKLKDLRATEDKGIKRFFSAAGPSSPGKRQKIERREDLESEGELDAADEAREDYESMPGYEEHEFEEAGLEIEIPDDLATGASSSGQALRPASHAKPPSFLSHTKPASSSSKPVSTKPRSSAHKPRSAAAPKEGVRSCICPICGKIMDTDNSGLNAHVDFCLSRGAILEAQVQSLNPQERKGKKR